MYLSYDEASYCLSQWRIRLLLCALALQYGNERQNGECNPRKTMLCIGADVKLVHLSPHITRKIPMEWNHRHMTVRIWTRLLGTWCMFIFTVSLDAYVQFGTTLSYLSIADYNVRSCGRRFHRTRSLWELLSVATAETYAAQNNVFKLQEALLRSMDKDFHYKAHCRWSASCLDRASYNTKLGYTFRCYLLHMPTLTMNGIAWVMCWHYSTYKTQKWFMGQHRYCTNTKDWPDMTYNIASHINWRRGPSMRHGTTVPPRNVPRKSGYHKFVAHVSYGYLNTFRVDFTNVQLSHARIIKKLLGHSVYHQVCRMN